MQFYIGDRAYQINLCQIRLIFLSQIVIYIIISNHASKALHVVIVWLLKHHDTISLIVLTIRTNAVNYLASLNVLPPRYPLSLAVF